MDKDLVFCRLILVTFLAAYLSSTILIIVSDGLARVIGLFMFIGSFACLYFIIKRWQG